MAVEGVIGVAVISGKGGVGKSVIALNLALALGRAGVKTLLFDAAGGDSVHLTNTGDLLNSGDNPQLINLNDNVGLYISSIADSYSIIDEQDIENFLSEIVRSSANYQCVVFDCLTGAGPVAYALAGLSELSILVTTADPTAIAGTYLLAKSLHQDGLAARAGLLLNKVESADEAASLKTRFDILTSQFLQRSFDQVGYIHNDNLVSESVLEQHPLLSDDQTSPAVRDFLRLADEIGNLSGLHTETSIIKG